MDLNKNKIPQFHELLKPIIIALKELGGCGSNKQINDRLVENLKLDLETASILHNNIEGRTELEYRSAWGRTYLKKAGYIDNPSRSTWRLLVDVNPDDIDPQKIVQDARDKAAKMTAELNQLEITKIEAAQAFERYVVYTLHEYLLFQNKTVVYGKANDKADLYIPDGIADIKKSVYVEIKYGTSVNIIEKIKGYCWKANSWINKNNEHILFIINEKNFEKKQLIQEIKDKYNIEITIWDVDELTNQIPTFPTKLEYLSNPRAAIVENVINEDNREKLIKENEKKIAALCEAYKSQKVVLFLGAGVSMNAGVPLWEELINRLLLRMLKLKVQNNCDSDGNDDNCVREFTEEDIEDICKIALQNKENTPLMQMRYIRAALDDDTYYSAVHDVLYADKININTKLLDSLAKISTPRREHKGLESIVTYNFDNLMEQSLDKWGVEYNVIQTEKMPVTDRLNIYHVHGYLPQYEGNIVERSELIFSEEDYHRVYGDAYCWSNMAQVKAFQDNICLFVGCSLTDPNLRRLLDNAMRHTEDARHFAILPRKSFKINEVDEEKAELLKWYQEFDDGIRNQIYKSFGINVIWINEYEEIPGILDGLVGSLKNDRS